MATEWLLMKRGLYYRPDDCGYTGIRDHAGRYSFEEAQDRASNGVTIISLADAPEFSEACFDDLARKHLTEQRDAIRAERDRLAAEVNVLRAENNVAARVADANTEANRALAAEVERLEKLNAALLNHEGDAEAVCNSYAEENQRLHDEVERLTALVDADASELADYAQTVRRLRGEVERLRAALEPFAEVASVWNREPADLAVELLAVDGVQPCVTVGAFRRAAAAHEQCDPKEG